MYCAPVCSRRASVLYDCELSKDQAIAFNLNAYLLDPANLRKEFLVFQSDEPKDRLRQVYPIECADGLKLSVQASCTHYCTPRDSVGPWVAVEIGYPSERVEELMAYADNPDAPTDTVYGWVPVEVVEAVIEKHGGIIEPCLNDSP